MKIRARSTQTPHKLGHIADRTAANSCPIHQGGGQEAYGDLQLRVRTFQWKHKSEPAADYSLARGNVVSPYGRSESQAPLHPTQCRGAQPASSNKTLPYSLQKGQYYRKYFPLFQYTGACNSLRYIGRVFFKKKKVLQNLQNQFTWRPKRQLHHMM